MRTVEAFLMIFMCFKSLYFLRLIKDVAPLIDAISNIVNDIKWFGFVYICFMISHGIALFSLSANQRDVLPPGSSDHAAYLKTSNLIWNTYRAHIGSVDTNHFRGNEMETYFVIIYIYMTLFVQLVLLNMLIGLMGESIGRSKEDAEAKKRM